MSTSRFGAVVDALVTLADATSVAQVFDGPSLTADSLTEYVVIGGTEDPGDNAGEITQEWNGIGAKARQEQGEVQCAVLVSTGDDTVKTARDRALAIRGEIETALRADPSLGGVLAPGWAHLNESTAVQLRNTNGLAVRLPFRVTYQTRI